jgi:hypothetical protein
MSDYAQGGIAHLVVEFLDHPQGQPVDPTSISLQILQGSTPIAGPWTYPGTIVRDLTGGLYRVVDRCGQRHHPYRIRKL